MKTVTKSGQLIEEIASFLAEDLAAVDAHMASVLDSETDLVREVGQYIRATQGKKLRPMMVLLSSRAFGYTGSDHTKVAAAMELVHTATLVHDDVIDKAPLRRGLPTVNARWGDDVAILIADFLYSRAFNLAVQALEPQILTMLLQVTSKMCEGEMFQIEKGDALLSREDYLRIVRSKTAFLFGACTGLGGVLAKAGEERTADVTRYGLEFGIAFQITDDLLDMIAPDDELGKQHGTDIRNGKQTLPLIRTMEVAEEADRADLWSCWNNGRDPKRILGHIRKYRGLELALEEAREYAESSKSFLACLPPSQAQSYCAQLSDFVLERTR